MANRFSPEVRVRAIRMVFEHQGYYETQAGVIAAIAPKIGCISQTLGGWSKQAEKDNDAEVKELHAKIGKLAVENDFLSQGLKR